MISFLLWRINGYIPVQSSPWENCVDPSLRVCEAHNNGVNLGIVKAHLNTELEEGFISHPYYVR